MEKLHKGKKVLILGLGINQGGLGATRFFIQQGAKVRVTDLKKAEELQPSLDVLKEFPNIEYTLGEHKYEDINWADLVIKNPALKPDNPYVLYAKERGKQVEMDMGIFLQFVKPSQIIGVTGTKGKSTTASLIHEGLKAAGKEIVFVGNIGKSVLDSIPFIKPETLVVLELSSFQLESFETHKASPKWAVITNIYPDHLNYYQTMDSYIEAKRVIAKYQKEGDYFFFKKEDAIVNNPNFLKGFEGQLIPFSAEDLPKNFSPSLPGKHNLENYAAALAILDKILDLASPDHILRAWDNFPGVEFRLQLIYDKNRIKIYNDTAATNPNATIQALKSLPNSILICGGVNKNLPYEELAKAIGKYAKAVYFLEGTATDEITRFLTESGHQSPDKIQGVYNNLERILMDVKNILKHGDIILFSPGAASFNLFQNEFDRGRKFNTAVGAVFK